MFTGIIREIGTVEALERSTGLIRLSVYAPNTASTVQRLESVAVNGVCLSVVDLRRGALIFEVIRETARLTTVGDLRAGDRVNLEPSLSMVDRLNGHVVLGHIDGIGAIIRRRALPGELILEVRIGAGLRRFLVPKGPITVDGVSLTVGSRLTASTCSLHLIPETLRQTTLGSRRIGDRVNVEVDYFAKLLRQFASRNVST